MRIALTLWAVALLLRPLKHMVALPVLVNAMRPWHRRDDAARRTATVRELRAYIERRGRPPFRAPGNCLERSVGAYRVLCGVKAAPCLVIGVRPVDGRIDGHVWIELDGEPFGDDPARIAQYTRVASFDGRGGRWPAGVSDAVTRGIRWA